MMNYRQYLFHCQKKIIRPYFNVYNLVVPQNQIFNPNIFFYSTSVLLKETIRFKNINTNNSIIDNNINKLCSYYKSLNYEEKNPFLTDLAMNYSNDYNAVRQTLRTIANEEYNDSKFVKIKEKLKNELTPLYHWLFIHIGRQKHGVKFLVDMRTDLLDLLKEKNLLDSVLVHLQQLDRELKELLLLWFSVGFLKLERITWKSSCEMLQKISDYEAVHPVRSWTDMKKRVGDDRRCFVYTHSSMPREPLVVLHTALRPDIISSLTGLTAASNNHNGNLNPSIAPLNRDEVHAAIFYSISSTQRGLQGIELGNYIIKRVAKELIKEFPKLNKFSTLSPMPKFKSWFFDKLKFAESDQKLLKELFSDEEMVALRSVLKSDNVLKEISKQLCSNVWLHEPKLVEVLKNILIRLTVRYLCVEKKRGYALCSVANFHLRNGAELWRVNWMADTTARGLSSSCGIMVNYRYRLEETDRNSQEYIQNKTITTSKQIKAILNNDQ